MHVTIHTAALSAEDISITNSAAKRVRMAFNPSKLPNVERLKALAAAFISECERLSAENPNAAREFATAATGAWKASMCAVAGATEHLS